MFFPPHLLCRGDHKISVRPANPPSSCGNINYKQKCREFSIWESFCFPRSSNQLFRRGPGVAVCSTHFSADLQTLFCITSTLYTYSALLLSVRGALVFLSVWCLSLFCQSAASITLWLRTRVNRRHLFQACTLKTHGLDRNCPLYVKKTLTSVVLFCSSTFWSDSWRWGIMSNAIFQVKLSDVFLQMKDSTECLNGFMSQFHFKGCSGLSYNFGKDTPSWTRGCKWGQHLQGFC